MYIYVYVYIYICMYICIYICIYVRSSIYVFTRSFWLQWYLCFVIISFGASAHCVYTYAYAYVLLYIYIYYYYIQSMATSPRKHIYWSIDLVSTGKCGSMSIFAGQACRHLIGNMSMMHWIWRFANLKTKQLMYHVFIYMHILCTFSCFKIKQLKVRGYTKSGEKLLQENCGPVS